MEANLIKKKLVVVGDGATGKTCMLMVYNNLKFPRDYIPTIFENHVTEFELDNQRIQLTLWDTAGQEDYDRLRTLSYPSAEVILICYSIDQRASLDNIAAKWIPEVKRNCSKIPIFIVSTKIDLRNSQAANGKQKTLISPEEGKKVAKVVGATGFMECSALTGEGLQEVFMTATRAAIKFQEKKRCTVL